MDPVRFFSVREDKRLPDYRRVRKKSDRAQPTFLNKKHLLEFTNFSSEADKICKARG